MMKKYMMMALCLCISAACSEIERNDVSGLLPEEIRIEASCPATKVTDDVFEAGDAFGLYAVEYEGDKPQIPQIGGNYLNNECMKYDGQNWRALSPVYWSDRPCDFYAVYPYQDMTSLEGQIVELQHDQSYPGDETELGGYEASDLLWAKAEKVSRADGQVNLRFKHMMSRLMVKVVKGEKFVGELPENISVKIYNTVTSAKVNFITGGIERNVHGTKNIITAKRFGKDLFSAILVPQSLHRKTPLVEISMDGVSYLMSYSFVFRPGRQYMIQVVVNKSPDQEKIDISIDGEIQPW